MVILGGMEARYSYIPCGQEWMFILYDTTIFFLFVYFISLYITKKAQGLKVWRGGKGSGHALTKKSKGT